MLSLLLQQVQIIYKFSSTVDKIKYYIDTTFHGKNILQIKMFVICIDSTISILGYVAVAETGTR